MRPHWLAAAQLQASLPLLSGLMSKGSGARIGTTELAWAPIPGELPRELAHDRWLRSDIEVPIGAMEIEVPAGAMTAVRKIAPLDDQIEGWLMEPSHFHLARDHVVLAADAVRGLDMTDARRLLEAIKPLLDDEGLAATLLSPDVWAVAPAKPWQVAFSSGEAAGGRNVAAYLPAGPDERRYRKLLNEIQMTWHDHAVNQEREARGELPVNSVWTSGPVAPKALAAWNAALALQRVTLDQALLQPRLRDDQSDWLDALQALDGRLHALLVSPDAPRILLCGDRGARWLTRQPGGLTAWSAAAVDGLVDLARGAQRWSKRWRTDPNRRAAGSASKAEPLAAFFTEAEE